MTQPIVPTLPIADCPDGAGTLNSDTAAPGGGGLPGSNIGTPTGAGASGGGTGQPGAGGVIPSTGTPGRLSNGGPLPSSPAGLDPLQGTVGAVPVDPSNPNTPIVGGVPTPSLPPGIIPPGNGGAGNPLTSYVPPDICIGTFDLNGFVENVVNAGGQSFSNVTGSLNSVGGTGNPAAVGSVNQVGGINAPTNAIVGIGGGPGGGGAGTPTTNTGAGTGIYGVGAGAGGAGYASGGDSGPSPAASANNYQESLAAENLNISGAPVNVFKLLGVHEQGKLVNLAAGGVPISSSNNAANAFDINAPAWESNEKGMDVIARPAWIGYDFGYRLTSYGQLENAPGVSKTQHITRMRIKQSSVAAQRVRQVRIERSNGGYTVRPTDIVFVGAGNGGFGDYKPGYDPRAGVFLITFTSATTFNAVFNMQGTTTQLIPGTVGFRYNSQFGSFVIVAGTTPFTAGDVMSAPVTLDWYRVDVKNLPDVPEADIEIKQSSASRYWRIIPLVFNGFSTSQPWVVEKLELFDYQATSLDNIQDTLLMENRDRDYANASIMLKAAYTPFDANSDLSKFGFQVAETYSFTTHFATMVQKLGRPLVVGDVIEVPSELQWDHNLKPVRKFLEITDVGWAAEGYTTAWKPIIYRFQAAQLLPSQEHRDILGTADTQKYLVDDGSFFAGIEQIQTRPLTATEANQAEAEQAVPEKGTNVREAASGTNRFKAPGTYDGTGPYVEDGLPPDGLPYDEGFKLPDVAGQTDGRYFRLNYDPKLNIPARLYKFSIVKNKWIYVETDRRTQRSAHRPSQLAILDSEDVRSLRSKL